MQGLEIQLVIGLDRHEAHRGSSHGLSNGLGVDVVTLVRLHVWFHVLRRDKPNFMPLFSQGTAEKMGATTGFHAD